MVNGEIAALLEAMEARTGATFSHLCHEALVWWLATPDEAKTSLTPLTVDLRKGRAKLPEILKELREVCPCLRGDAPRRTK